MAEGTAAVEIRIPAGGPLPRPFTNTDTRGTINFGRNYTNNPVTNSGGSGIASLLTGYINNAARGFLLEPYTLRTQEHGLFVQDDIKVSPRFTVNAGVRYEIFRAETEEHNKIVNFDPVGLRLIYAGEDGASRSVNKRTDYGNVAPRLGLTYDLFGTGTTILRGGFGITYFPEQPSASNMIGQQVPYTISQNVNFATNPIDFSVVRTIADPFPAIAPVKPRTTAELQAANPRVLGHSFANETPYAEQWHLWRRAPVLAAMAVELTYAGSAGKHLVFCYNPNEVQPGIGSQESRRLIQPLNLVSNIVQCDPRNRSTYHSGQLKVTQRFSGGVQFLGSYTYGKALDYGGSAASGGGAVGNPQTITDLDAGHGPAGFDVRHRAVVSGVWELPWGQGRRWLSNGGALGAVAGGWQISGIGTVTTGRPFTVFMQNGVNNGAPSWPNRIGSGSWTTRRSISGTTLPISSPRPRTPTAIPGAAFFTLPGTSTWTRRCPSVSPCSDGRTSSSGGTRSTCSTIPDSDSRTRTSTRPPRAASRRPSSTTVRCSSR